MLAGMGGVAYHQLVAAVSEAGGFGCFGASTMSGPQLETELAAARERTTKPFGVDLLTALPAELEANVDRLIAGGATAFVAGLGVPRDVIDTCHRHNVLVGSIGGKVRHAIAAVEAGCDFVIAQGTEAGGHTGFIATMALVPQVVDAVEGRVPVVAAGGIADGRGLAAALVLGADGVWVGTRFIGTPEARTVAGYKEAVVRSAEDDTVITRSYSGKPMRAIRNEWTQRFEEHPEQLQPFPVQLGYSIDEGAFHLGGDATTPGVDPAIEGYPAGQVVGAITELVPAGVLVQRFVDEAERAIANAPR